MGNSRKGKFDAKHIESVTATVATATITTADIGTATVDDMTLSSTYYRRHFIPVQQMHSTGGAAYTVEAATSNHATVVTEWLGFDEATIEMASFQWMFPADWKVGTSITPYIHYMTTSSTGAGAQKIGWGLAYSIRDALSSTVAASMSAEVIYALDSTTALEIMTTNWTAIGTTAYDVDSIFTGALFRNATASTDAYAKDGCAMGITFVYEVDSMGTTSAALSSKS